MVLLDNNIFLKCPPKTAVMLRILKKKMVFFLLKFYIELKYMKF